MRAQEDRDEREGIGLGLSVRDEVMRVGFPPTVCSQPVGMHTNTPSPPPRSYAQSLPKEPTRPWKTATTTTSPFPEVGERIASLPVSSEEAERPANPLLDVTKARVTSAGRGALYSGSVFRGTQTSGRSAYEVEVRFLVGFALVLAFFRADSMEDEDLSVAKKLTV